MKKFFPLYALLALCLTVTVSSCNDDDDSNSVLSGIETTTSYTSTQVSAFKLGANEDVLYNLDSVFFAIDQDNCLIYNVDSLPVGTDVSHLTVSVTFPNAVSKAQFVVKDGTVMKDSTFDYTSETTDSIDFTGKVKLEVTSYDGTRTRTYDIKVNVHQMEPDSLQFNLASRRDLPNASSFVLAAKAAKMADSYYCLTRDEKGYAISNASNPGVGTWNKVTPNFGFTPNVESLTGTDNGLYILSSDGALYKSEDQGATWNSCGVTWASVVGAYGCQLLGVMKDGDNYLHDMYPREGYEPTAVADGFPVKGSSPFVLASNEWTVAPQGMMVGGYDKSGNLHNSTWGFDGKRWAEISNSNTTNDLPALEGAVICGYSSFSVDTTTHRATESNTWVLMGGRKADGTLNATTYVSYNQGISWTAAGNSMQQPSYMPQFYGAQAFVVSEKLPKAKVIRRANTSITPITEWTCPYIYIVGGKNASGSVLSSIWKGAINRLTFKPQY